MPLFALPLSDHANATNSRTHLSSLPDREKSQRAASPSPSSDSEPSSDNDANPRSASTNPLSLTPAEIAQYKLAGLRLDEEIPNFRDFPHRPLPTKKLRKRTRKGKEAAVAATDSSAGENTEDERAYKKKSPSLRMQHLGVLTAILHKCLMDGDIPRATRAFAMLIRLQFGGHSVDIRSSGYWGIGAELLVRRMDKPNKDSEIEEGGEPTTDKSSQRRWGTKEGLDRAKDYYERLILQYPYNRQFGHAVSAIDFWPAMLGCEIYGIQLEQRDRLAQIEVAEEQGSDDDEEIPADEEDESFNESIDDDGIISFSEKRKTRRRRIRAEKHWQERENIRHTTLKASEVLAARMKELMNPPPYSDNHALLRLRGMLALYIGDLSVPTPHPDDEELEDEELSPSQNLRSRRGKNAEDRSLGLERSIAIVQGKRKREQEQARAKKFFAKIIKNGGWVQGHDDVADEKDQSSEEESSF